METKIGPPQSVRLSDGLGRTALIFQEMIAEADLAEIFKLLQMRLARASAPQLMAIAEICKLLIAC